MKNKRLLPLSLMLGALSIASCGDLSDLLEDKNEEKSNEDVKGFEEEVNDTPTSEDSKESSDESKPEDKPKEEEQEKPSEEPEPEVKPKEIVVSSMSFDASSYIIAINESKTINLTYNSNADNELTFVWFSDDSTICNVIDGRIYGMKPGICNVTAYYDSNKNNKLDSSEKSATAQVRVYNPTMTIYLDSSNYTVAINESVTASPSFEGGLDNNPQFSWKSDNTNIATVSNGVITGKSSGTTSITCYYDENKNSNFDSGIDPFCKASVTVESLINVSKTMSIKYYPGYSKSSTATLPDEKFFSTNINVYNINLEGEVPYINFSTFQNILLYQTGFISNSNASSFCKFTEVSDGKYKLDVTPSNTYISGELRSATMYFDINNNKITCDNITKFTTIRQSWNNGVPNDMCSPTGIVQTSSKSKYITNPSETVFDLNHYNIHMHKINNTPYIPLHVALSLNGGYDMYYYDGKKLLDSMVLSEEETSYFYSNNNNFVLPLTVSSSSNYKLTFTRQNNSNDFYAYYYDVSGTYNNFKATLNLSSNTLSVVGSRGSTPNTINSSNLSYSSTFNVTNWGNFYEFKKSGTTVGYMNLEDNRFNNDTYQEKMKEFNYNFLTFRLDYYYGLKEDFLRTTGYTSFNNYFRNKKLVLQDYRGTNIRPEDTIYNQIMNASNITEYSNVLAYIIADLLGDGHTLFKTRSPLCGVNANIDTALSQKYTSERNRQLSAYANQYYQQRGVAQGYVGYPKMNVSGSTAILQFDSFNGNYIDAHDHSQNMESFESVYLEGDPSFAADPKSLYASLINSLDTFTAIYFAISKIVPKYSGIKNIVFDVTNNGGGAVLLLPQLTSIMTSDPTVVFKDTLNGGVGEYHYEVDANGDGQYNSQDTFADKYNFYVLQSEFSFSCGNAFPSVCRNMGCAKIIGSANAGGGACPVSYGYDAFGSQFQISARHNIMVKNSNGTYINNDEGCPADKVLENSKWYRPDLLDSWINSNF